MKRMLALLLCGLVSLQAQTVPTNTVIVGYENSNNFNIPAGSFVFQYGCAGSWSGPLTITGPLNGKGLNFLDFGLANDPTCPGVAGSIGQPSIIVQQQSVSFVIGVTSWNTDASAYTNPQPLTVAALVPDQPPVTQPTCSPNASTITYNADGSIDIHEAPNCMLIQPKGAWGVMTDLPGYNILITGDGSLPLFAPGNGTNVAQTPGNQNTQSH